ncbi:ATP-binding protein [Streptomyces gibsoniae]|uniref:ATP-binding protein n=1 Tax=Streptomyces gibsoniae TaxID=3075529 RepID=A0ABU2U090_9ACTN|nr:ATP-binding protein [Streptomyces sp. DSM 41699]MDT0466599.1 ATP-binding protein [Streptomyces sp. DSM 41699]
MGIPHRFPHQHRPGRRAWGAGRVVHRRTWLLPHRPEAAGRARRHTRNFLVRRRIDQPTIEKVLLLVSELVTNAVEHARPPIMLHLQVGPRQVRVEVTDGGPARREAAWTASCGPDEHGRGLYIVDQVATAHGDSRAHRRTLHWADLTTAA